jgi:Flp pilus assembly protein TadD
VQVVHCLALAADMSGDSAAAIRWLEVLTSLVPHDPGVLCKLGAIYHRCGPAQEFGTGWITAADLMMVF